MAFDTSEKSLYDAQPIELYEFVGTLNTYRMTTYSDSVISGAQTYTPLAGLKRSVLKTGTQEEENLALDVTLPYDHPLVSEYAYKTAPPSLQLTVYRAHATDPNDRIVMWEGKVLSFSVEGRLAKMRVPALFAYLLNGIAPAPRYQAPCNHVLYDSRCAVNPATHQVIATVTAITNNIVTIDSWGAMTPTDTIGGDLSWVAGGENRMIISMVGLDITTTYPFANLTAGQSVTLRRGCDHTFTQCKARFSNGPQFGGHPLVPDKNPFTSKP